MQAHTHTLSHTQTHYTQSWCGIAVWQIYNLTLIFAAELRVPLDDTASIVEGEAHITLISVGKARDQGPLRRVVSAEFLL